MSEEKKEEEKLIAPIKLEEGEHIAILTRPYECMFCGAADCLRTNNLYSNTRWKLHEYSKCVYIFCQKADCISAFNLNRCNWLKSLGYGPILHLIKRMWGGKEEELTIITSSGEIDHGYRIYRLFDTCVVSKEKFVMSGGCFLDSLKNGKLFKGGQQIIEVSSKTVTQRSAKIADLARLNPPTAQEIADLAL